MAVGGVNLDQKNCYIYMWKSLDPSLPYRLFVTLLPPQENSLPSPAVRAGEVLLFSAEKKITDLNITMYISDPAF